MNLKVVNETTDKSATSYHIDVNGKKQANYRESIWNSEPKFYTIYYPDDGMKQILRAPDVINEYTYVNDILHGGWYTTRYQVDRNLIMNYLLNNVDVNEIQLPERIHISGEYRHGKKHGLEQEYIHGELVRESRYSEGKLDGVVRRYYTNHDKNKHKSKQVLYNTMYYIKGVKHGPETHYTEDGGVYKTELWYHGRKVNL